MTISDINESSISFVIVVTSESNKEISISASKQQEKENATKTELLCQTWELVSINEQNVIGTEDETTVLFSKAGTYLVSNYDKKNNLAQWKWKNGSKTELLYSWEENPNWEYEDFIEIRELTKTSLKIFEKFSGEESYFYVLKPLINTKSANINSTVSTQRNITKSGFLKKQTSIFLIFKLLMGIKFTY